MKVDLSFIQRILPSSIIIIGSMDPNKQKSLPQPVYSLVAQGSGYYLLEGRQWSLSMFLIHWIHERINDF